MADEISNQGINPGRVVVVSDPGNFGITQVVVGVMSDFSLHRGERVAQVDDSVADIGGKVPFIHAIGLLKAHFEFVLFHMTGAALPR